MRYADLTAREPREQCVAIATLNTQSRSTVACSRSAPSTGQPAGRTIHSNEAENPVTVQRGPLMIGYTQQQHRALAMPKRWPVLVHRSVSVPPRSFERRRTDG